jgi:light-regulated signal transduction histidine kinase (bacteriophytochrome)
MEIWTLWTPTYWLSGAIKAVTAAASVPTAILLIRLVPRVLAVPTQEQLGKAIGDLGDRTADLEVANRELESFSHSVAHDLRAPLRGINGFAQILKEDYGSQLDQEGTACIEEIQINAVRMAALIDALLSLSRLTRSELRPERVDLSAIGRRVARELEAFQPARKVTFSIQEGLWAYLDPRLASTLLENLLGNAWKFSAGSAAPRIELGIASEKGPDVYFVRDNGAGFDQAFADKLFVPFQRLHTQEQFPGTGIGLATARRIMVRHGGRIWAEGRVGGGATFFFTFPRPEVVESRSRRPSGQQRAVS